MKPLPLSAKIAAVLAALYGLVSIAGGTLGYVNKGSVPSLVAGGIAGVLLLLCAAGTARKPAWALLGAAVIATALVGRFLSPALNPPVESGHETAYTVAVVMAAGGVLVFLASGFALARKGGCGS